MKSIETIGSVKHISLEDVDAKKFQFLIIFVLFQMAEEEPPSTNPAPKNLSQFWKDFKIFLWYPLASESRTNKILGKLSF